MTEKQWQAVLGVAAAIITFLLMQPDVVLPPWVKVILGAANVGIAVLAPNKLAGDEGDAG